MCVFSLGCLISVPVSIESACFMHVIETKLTFVLFPVIVYVADNIRLKKRLIYVSDTGKFVLPVRDNLQTGVKGPRF
jgi:hypothetical protein